MLKNKLFYVFSLLSITVSYSQLAINSPYSRFGVGNLNTQTNAILNCMSGVGTSYAAQNYINTSNPALLNRLSTTTFELGAGYNYLLTAENNNKNSSSNYQFDYIAIGFPLHRNFTTALSLKPYSDISYNTEGLTALDSENDIKDIYEGSGGITSINWSNSFALLKDSVNNQTFSFGVDAALLMGNIEKSNQSTIIANGNENTSFSSVVERSTYRSTKLNFGLGFRKEFFVGDDFKTLNHVKCNLDSSKKTVIQTPKLFYDQRVIDRSKKSIKTKYVIIYPGSNEIKISKDIKNGERREQLLNNYSSIVRKGFGVLVLPTAEKTPYNELKLDYLDIYNSIKDEEPIYTTFENDKKYSKEYLRYHSGVFINVGFNYELGNNLEVSGSEEITRFRTNTQEALDNTYSLNEFENQRLVLPSIYKFGVSFDKPKPTGKDKCGNKKTSTWLAGLDFALKTWNNNSYYGANLVNATTYRIGLGGEIVPNKEIENRRATSKAHRFLSQLTYRAGIYHETLPFTFNSENISETGINFGVTIPANNNGGLLTWNISLASRGSELNETFIKTGLGLTLNERGWFRRSRVGL